MPEGRPRPVSRDFGGATVVRKKTVWLFWALPWGRRSSPILSLHDVSLRNPYCLIVSHCCRTCKVLGCYFLNVLRPERTTFFETAEQHDEAKWQTVLRLLEISPSSCVPNDSPEAQRRARERALLSMRHGGLGLRCAARANVSAYWSAWADALPVLHDKVPEITAMLVGELSRGDTATSMSLSSAARAKGALEEDGFHDIPDWRSIVEGVRAPRPQERPEGDEPRHGWQAKAHQFRKKSVR